MKKRKTDLIFSDLLLENELKRNLRSKHRKAVLRNVLSGILIVTALLILLSSTVFPIYRISEKSDTVNLKEARLVIACRLFQPESGDLASYEFENQLVFGQVIGLSGDIVEQKKDGTLTVNNEIINDVTLEKAGLDISYPYRLDENQYLLFEEISSRQVRIVSADKIIGKVFFCLWPLNKAGYIG